MTVQILCFFIRPCVSFPISSVRPENYRRAALRERTISVKIFYNGKLVSTTSQSPFNRDFRVNIEETFNMQVTNWPESLMLEVYHVHVWFY